MNAAGGAASSRILILGRSFRLNCGAGGAGLRPASGGCRERHPQTACGCLALLAGSAPAPAHRAKRGPQRPPSFLSTPLTPFLRVNPRLPPRTPPPRPGICRHPELPHIGEFSCYECGRFISSHHWRSLRCIGPVDHLSAAHRQGRRPADQLQRSGAEEWREENCECVVNAGWRRRTTSGLRRVPRAASTSSYGCEAACGCGSRHTPPREARAACPPSVRLR